MTAPDDALAAIEARAAAAVAAVTEALDGALNGWPSDAPVEVVVGYVAHGLTNVGDLRAVLSIAAHITALRAQHAADVAAAVAGERERCAAVCRDIASAASDDDPVSETADACAEAIERADALTAPAATTGGA